MVLRRGREMALGRGETRAHVASFQRQNLRDRCVFRCPSQPVMEGMAGLSGAAARLARSPASHIAMVLRRGREMSLGRGETRAHVASFQRRTETDMIGVVVEASLTKCATWLTVVEALPRRWGDSIRRVPAVSCHFFRLTASHTSGFRTR